MEPDLQKLFETEFRSIPQWFKEYLIRRGLTTITSLKRIPTQHEALKIFFADCPEVDQQLRHTFQKLLFEVNPDRANKEYVSISRTAKQFAEFQRSLLTQKDGGPQQQPASSGDSLAFKDAKTSSAPIKPPQQPSYHKKLTTVEEESVPNRVAISTPPVKQNAPLYPQRRLPQVQPSNNSSSSVVAKSNSAGLVDRDRHASPNHAPSNPVPLVERRPPPSINASLQSDAKRLEQSGSSKSIVQTTQQDEGLLLEKIALLGRQTGVGAEYNACMDVFFDSNAHVTFDIKCASDDSNVPELSVMPFPSSLTERLNILGLGLDQKVNYLVGLVQNKLIANLATEPVAGNDEEKAIIHFRYKSHAFSRHVAAASYKKNNVEATHVTVGVEYGTQWLFILSEKKNKEKSLLKYLTEVIDRIKRAKKEAGISIGAENRFTKISCKAYCNCAEEPTKNFFQAAIILNSLLVEKSEQKQPQTAIVLPLHRPFASLSQETFDEIERFALLSASTHRSLIELRGKYPDFTKMIGIDDLEAALRSMFEQAFNVLRKTLIDVRRGATDEKRIVEFLREKFTRNKKQADLLKYAEEAINAILIAIQKPLVEAGISDRAIDPKIVLEIAISPIDQSGVQAYFSTGDAHSLFPWLRSLGNEKSEDVKSFIEFRKANHGKEQHFCYRFKRNTNSSRLLTCLYENRGETFVLPHRISGGFVNISSKLISTKSIALSVEVCWTREGLDNGVATTKMIPCEARVSVDRKETITTTTVPNDVIFEDLRENTCYEFAVELIFPGGFALTQHQWAKKFFTLESRAQKLMSKYRFVENERGFYSLPKRVVVMGEGYRKYEVGSPNIDQLGEKVILVVGGTGSGKSTFINAMANYLYEVGFFDPFRLQLITKEDEFNESGLKNQAKSQTKFVSAYELNETRSPYRVTIVDTPGFGDTEGVRRDKVTMEYIKEWFKQRNATGLQTIDAVCIVIKSTESRLTARAKYELQLVQALFGENIRSNIITVFTFSDSHDPVAKEALNNDGLLIGEHMLNFNNRCYIEMQPSDSLLDAFWKRTTKSFEKFFAIVESFEPRSVVHTLEVLRHRRALERRAIRFTKQITAQIKKIRQIEQVIEQLNNGISDHRWAQNFTIKQKRFKPVEVTVKSGTFTTFCKKCSFTCHEDCKEVKEDDRQRFNCDMMTVKDPNSAHCTICPNKCRWNDHVHSNIILKQVECEEVVTAAQIFEQYRINTAGRNSAELAELLLELLAKDLMTEDKILGDTVKAIRQNLNILNEIALRPGLTTDSKYLIHLIKAEEQAMEVGAAERVGVLKRHLRIVKLLEDEQEAGGCLNCETESVSIAYLGHKFPKLYKQLAAKGYFATNTVRLDSRPISSETMVDYVERQYPVEFRTASKSSNDNLPPNASKAVMAECFSRTFPSLSAAALKQLKEEAISPSPGENQTSFERSGDQELDELNKLIDQVKLTEDAHNDHVPKPAKRNIGVWKRLKGKFFTL